MIKNDVVDSTVLCSTVGFSTILSCMRSKLRWKASLMNKRQRKLSLSEEDVEFLVQNTQFSAEDIQVWYKQFIAECPNVNYWLCCHYAKHWLHQSCFLGNTWIGPSQGNAQRTLTRQQCLKQEWKVHSYILETYH